jgi:lysozyme
MSKHVSCIDISHWQNFPDFDQVAAAGVIAMIHKATEGTSYVDPNRAKNCVNAMAAGISCCTYHWLKPGNADAQIAHYLRVVDPVEGELMVIDYEEDGCTLHDLHEAVDALLADDRGLKVAVYSGHLLKEQLNGDYDSLLAENTTLWLAQYTTGEPSWPSGTYPQWSLWQYSESGTIPGISGSKVDLNRFNGSDDELLAWISPEAGPVPEPARAVVEVNISTTRGVEISVVVNGRPVVI